MEVAAVTPQLMREVIDGIRQLQRSGLLANLGGSRESGMSSNLIYVRNTTTEAIPPFACMQAIGTEEIGSQNYVQVRKPADIHGAAQYFLWNGPREIEASGNGVATDGLQIRALIKPAEPTTASLRFAPTVGQWYMSEDPLGMIVSSGPDDIGDQIIKAKVDGGPESIIVYTMGSVPRNNTGAGVGSGIVQRIVSGSFSPWTSQAGQTKTVSYFTIKTEPIGEGYAVLVRGRMGEEWYEVESSTTLSCTDQNRPITDIRWESPKLQYRKSTACPWVDILTASACSTPTSPPGSLASTGTTTTSVSLSWTDNSTNEDGFQVEYKASSSGTWLVFTTTAANATTATVTGLTAGTSYDFRVAATNVYGMSSYSTVTGISTSAEP